jgi:hypothetical protein
VSHNAHFATSSLPYKEEDEPKDPPSTTYSADFLELEQKHHMYVATILVLITTVLILWTALMVILLKIYWSN